MKRMLLFTGVVAVLAMLAGPAMAVTLPAGTMAASAVDQSSLFSYDAGTGLWSPITTGGTPAVGMEQRSVFSINAIEYGTFQEDALGKYVDPGTTSVPYTNHTIAGMVYDLVIGNVVPNAAGFPSLYFVPGGRYKDDGSGTDGTWADKYSSPSGVAATANGWGGLMVAYAGPPNFANFDPGAGNGQDEWVDEGGPPSSDGALNDSDAFPTISHVGAVSSTTARDPWLIAVFGPLFTAPNATVVFESGQTTGWRGTGYANVIGGTFASMIQQDTFGPLRDLRLDFTVTVPFSGGSIVLTEKGWQTSSVDPISLHVLPEPATMTLMGLGLAALGGVGALRRRRK